MLHVPVTVRPSPIHGLGVFAAAPIVTPGFDLETDPAQLDSLPPPWRERLQHYGYVDRRLEKFETAALAGRRQSCRPYAPASS